MSYSPRYDKGNWKAVCESCGRIVKASDLQRRWDGYMVDERCFETRQPQDFVRGVADYQAPPFTRPEQSDSFIPFNWFQSFLTPLTSTVTLLTEKLKGLKTFFLSFSNTTTLTATKYHSTKAIDGSSVDSNTLG